MAAGGAAGITRILGEMLGVNEEVLRALGATHMAIREGMRDLHHMTEAQTEATETNTAVTEENIVAGEAQVAENEEIAASWYMSLGPITWIAAGLAALTAITLIATGAVKRHREELYERSKTADGMLIVDKEAREEYIRQAEAINKYKVLSGVMSQTDADIQQLRFNYKMDAQEFKNQTDEKLHEAKSFWQGMSTLYDDIYAGNLKDKNGELMNDAQEIIAMDAKREEGLKEIVLQEEILNKLVEKNIQLSKMSNSAHQAGEEGKLNSNLDISDDVKAAAMLKIKQKYAIEDIKLTEQDEDIKAAKIAQINNQTAADLDLLWKESARRHKLLDLQETVDAAKANKERYAIEKASYEQGLYELKLRLKKEGATRKETQDEIETFTKQHEENLRLIWREHEDVLADIQHKNTELIENSYDKELSQATNTFNDEIRTYTRMYEDKKITLDEWLEYSHAALIKEQQDSAEIERQRQARLTSNTDTNDVDRAKNVTRKDQLTKSNSLTKPKDILKDQLAENAIESKKALDDANAADAEAMRKGEMNESQHEEHIKNIKETYRLNDLENTKAYNDKKVDLETQQLEQISQALSEGLKDQNQMQLETLRTQAEDLGSEANVQAQLAAAGFKNSMDTILKDQAANEEQQKAIARKAAQEQEAMELSKMLFTAMNAYMKGGDDPGAAFLKAVTQVELTKALAAGITGGFYEGTDDTGNGGRMDSKGGFLSVLHPKEAVINRARNEEVPGLAKAWLEGDYERMSMLLPPVGKDIGGDELVVNRMIQVATDKLADRFENALKSQPHYTSATNADGEIVTQIFEGGGRKIIIQKKVEFPPRPEFLK